mgnify:CR=1 FL=1
MADEEIRRRLARPREQYAQLIEMHCDYVQGHYYAPSLEPARIDEILRANPVIAKEQRAAVRLAG